jgi:hypothetical protein
VLSGRFFSQKYRSLKIETAILQKEQKTVALAQARVYDKDILSFT